MTETVQIALDLTPPPERVAVEPLVCPTCHRPFARLSDSDSGSHHADAGETERAAALRQTPRIGTGRRRVLDAITAAGEKGRTDEELALELGMRLYTAAPRRNELLRGGWIVDSGRTRPTTTGSQATVWRISEWALAFERGA